MRPRPARRAWCSTTSIATAHASARSSATPMSAGAAPSSWPNGAATGPTTRSRSPSSRSPSSIRPAVCTASSDRERDWLEYGALLHDIGVHISYERHHRHSYYLIKNGDLRGFDPEEIEIIALIARYHRQATPKKSHEGYRDLGGSKRRAVKALSAMVRLAEGLDRSHSQALHGPGSLSARRRLPGAPPHRRRRRAGVVGRAPARRAARSRSRQAHSLRNRRDWRQGRRRRC